MRSGPADYQDGLGEVVRGFRLYTGVSRLAMAEMIGIAVRSYERIEDGSRSCPPGFLDTLQGIVVEFDSAVEDAVASGPAEPVVSISASGEWARAIACRAAVLSDRITPRVKD